MGGDPQNPNYTCLAFVILSEAKNLILVSGAFHHERFLVSTVGD